MFSGQPPPPSFSAFSSSLSLSLEHAHAHACVVRETDPAWKDREPKIRRGRNGHVRVLLERRKKEEEEEEEEGECVRERERAGRREVFIVGWNMDVG